MSSTDDSPYINDVNGFWQQFSADKFYDMP